jgi:hypothetical protein
MGAGVAEMSVAVERTSAERVRSFMVCSGENISMRGQRWGDI